MNETDQRKADKLKLEKYLNTNLGAYFKGRENAIHGVPRSKDVFGEAYKTYAFFYHDVSIDYINGRWHSAFSDVKRYINKIIDSLTIAKSTEKPECREIRQRHIEVHWRQFPEASIDDDCRLKISFHLNVHHKP